MTGNIRWLKDKAFLFPTRQIQRKIGSVGTVQSRTNEHKFDEINRREGTGNEAIESKIIS